MSTPAEEFEQAAKAALARELDLVQQQAARRRQEATAAKTDPARQLDRQRFAAGAYAQPGAAANAARSRAAEIMHAAVRHDVDGPEIAYGRDPW